MNWLTAPATETGITHGARLWLYVLCAALLAFLVLPTLIVIPMSFSASQFLQFPPTQFSLRWYAHFFGSSEWREAMVTSLEVAAWTAVVATALGTAAAYGLLSCGLRAARLAGALLLAPIMVPVILIAIGVFYAFVKLHLLHTLTGLVLADSTLAIPIATLVVSAALRGHDVRQEMAARSLGATRLGAFWRVTLPQIRFAVTTAAVLSFLTGFDEVVIALFISGGNHPTLTRTMFNALRDQIDPTIAAISTLMIAVSSLLLALTLVGRRRGGG